MPFWVMVAIYGIQIALAWLKGNAQQINRDLAPYVAQGEAALVAAVTKFSPVYGAILQAALNDLGPDVPKLEGDAVAWIEGVLSTYLKKLQGGS